MSTSMQLVAYCPTLLQYQQLTPSPPYYLPVLLKNLTVSIIGRSPGQPSAPEQGLLGGLQEGVTRYSLSNDGRVSGGRQ